MMDGRIRAIVTDIEGTTSSIHFVHDVLFPYARRGLPAFIARHGRDPEVRAYLELAAREADTPHADDAGITATLLGWIDEDRKSTALKGLQGLVWRDGYESGQYRAHVYPEVPARLRAWHAAGLRLYVYSSGSIAAQKLFFRYSEAGDLTGLFTGYFDTTSGPKRDAASYRHIAAAIGEAPQRILFLSDITEELDAARAAGWTTTWLVRPPATLPASPAHRAVADFDAIQP